jgi:hypothetical protein
MEPIQETKNVFFITDKNYILPKENESLRIQKFFDISKKQIFSFTTQNDELFIILNQNTFGSAFFGNTVLIKPKYFLIKKFNPILLLIQIIYADEKNDVTKNKNKAISDFIDTNAIIQKYEDKLKSLKDSEIFHKINFDEIFKSSMNLVKYVFEKHSKLIESIAETKVIEELEKQICAKKCESKIFNYINSKVNNISEEEKKELDEMHTANEKEKKELMERISFEKFSMLEPFIPNELYIKYRDYRFKEFVEDDEISKKSNNSEKSGNKRKATAEKKNKKKKNKVGEAERSKGQSDISSFFNKK